MALDRRAAVAAFAAFALAYFLTALLRAVTATLAPAFTAELGLTAADLGMLAGAYFIGFAAMQLPLGQALDRFGPKNTVLALISLAVVGCVAFARAEGLSGLTGARALIGMGVAACLLAPLTCYRRLFAPPAQLRANSWMLMTGSLGMLASTLPVQWLLPLLGWRGLFWALAAALALAMACIARWVPADQPTTDAAPAQPPARNASLAGAGYPQILRHPLFVRLAPLGFFVYGGLIAMQALWVGPWFTRVTGYTATQAAEGLFAVNLSMLLAFLGWGALMPKLTRRGVRPEALMRWGLPVALGLTGLIVVRGSAAGVAHWAAWCVACTFVSVSQPALGAAFPSMLAGRVMSAYNLVIFVGVFTLQWGIGLMIDALTALGWTQAGAFRVSVGVLGVLALGAYLWFVLGPGPALDADNVRPIS